MKTEFSSLLAQYEPISLASMDEAASLRTRVDTKYIVPWDIFNDLQQSLLGTHRALEIGGERIFTYDTQYFDTSNHSLYWAHIQGQRKRFKIRTRRYLETGRAFLEIKLKGGRGQTIKRRIPHDPDLLDVMDNEGSAFIQSCIEDLYGERFTAPLVPTVRTLYRRATLVAREMSERITCDFDLGFHQGGAAQAGLRQQFVLLEIKTANGRGAFDRELWQRGVRPMGGSKYCIGLSMIGEGMKNNALRRQIRRFYR